ncbi:sulfotransferase [Myxococcota bacterium]|nr:sulfotransferase [Myxococcota bacterium]
MSGSRADIAALTDFSKNRPRWVRTVNALGRPARQLISLDEAGLLEAARRRTGLSDFGGDDFREPLQVLLRSLEEEARLTFMGRLLARRDVFVLLCNRLKIVEAFRKHPEIADVQIREPLFIVGLSRSGTSILHELLTQDPRHRVLESWEARFPCPPPEEETYETDRRIRLAHFEQTLWPRLVPAYQAMHEMGGRMPTECGDITCNAFLGDRIPALHQVPSYAAFAAAQDIRPAYEIHKKILQILQWKTRGERWVLKAPAHMNWLDTLLDVYPDARVVQTHRDPLQIMGSTVSLISAILWMRAESIDPEQVKLAFGPAYYEPQLYHVMRLRDEGLFAEGQVFDVRFQDLMEDPFGTLAGVYGYFGWSYPEDVEARMRRYLEGKPRGKFGKHFYSFHDLGLDLATERARYARYQERYGVESEVT